MKPMKSIATDFRDYYSYQRHKYRDFQFVSGGKSGEIARLGRKCSVLI
jgi:hypothetical protein